MHHIYDVNEKKQYMEQLLKGDTKYVWKKRTSNEFGWLSQGYKHRVKPTDTIDFIRKQYVPENKKVTYSRVVCDYRTLKLEPYRVIWLLVVGGYNLIY